MNPSFNRVFTLILGLTLAPIAHAETTNASVTIDVVNAKLPVISVTYGNNSRQLTLADDAAIEIDGKKSDYRALLPGDKAVVTYDKVRSAVTKVVVQRDAIAPAEALAEGWQEIDQRLIFLMIRLANVEASLEAVERAIDADSRKKSGKANTARKADRDNEALDRKGGGPVKWSQFYGMTAEKFFYHPTDRNTSYHTITVLGQQGSQADNKVGGGVPAGQGLPVHQRPPQFDYIYRANDSAKARAEMEASELIGKIDALNERRQRLETEQAGLWVEIAFRAIAHYDLDKKPVYRFEPALNDLDADYVLRTEAMKSASSFMALALSIIGEAEKNQQATFLKLKSAVAKGRQTLNDSYLRLAVDNSDSQSSVGRFVALAKRLDDVSANLTDSYSVATEGDLAGDQQRKDTFRALLQSSLINYAQIILAMDEMAEQMKEECKFRPNVDKSIQFVGLSQTDAIWVPGQSSVKATQSELPNDAPNSPRSLSTESLFDGVSLNGWHTEGSQWKVNNGILIGEKLDPNESGSFLVCDRNYGDFDLYAEFKLHEGNSGIQIRSKKQSTGMVIGPQADITFQQDYRWLGCLTGERIQPEMIGQTSQAVKDRLRQVVDPNGWNSMKVSVRASQTTIFINDVKTVQSSLPAGFERGVIALQLHGGGRTRIEFRKIEIEEIKNEQTFDPFKQNSVWTNEGLKLTIIERRGGTFRARLECNEWARNIRGAIKNGQVTWLAKDVQPITGGVGGDNYGTISSDDVGYRMDVEWSQPNGVSGTGTYRLND